MEPAGDATACGVEAVGVPSLDASDPPLVLFLDVEPFGVASGLARDFGSRRHLLVLELVVELGDCEELRLLPSCRSSVLDDCSAKRLVIDEPESLRCVRLVVCEEPDVPDHLGGRFPGRPELAEQSPVLIPGRHGLGGSRHRSGRRGRRDRSVLGRHRSIAPV
jgi:hypothetical protein